MKIYYECEKDIVIYGTGKYASLLYRYLFSRFAEDKIKYFIVSKLGDEHFFLGKEVFSYEEKKDELKKYTLVLAVSEKNAKEIIETIDEKKIGKIKFFSKEFISNIETEINNAWMENPIQNNKIFFDAFWGLGYQCNPKYICEELLRRDESVTIVWDAIPEKKDMFPERVTPVVRGTDEFYREFYSSHIVVTNVNSIGGVEKKKGQFFINTWHGTGPFKKVGGYVYKRNGNQVGYDQMKKDYANVDLAIAACEQCTHNHRVAFEYEGKMENWGYPRNDIFFQPQGPIRNKVFEELGIDKSHKVALYAPTFRYSLKSGEKKITEVYDIDLKRVKLCLEERFGCDFTVLYRFHQYIYREIDPKDYFPDYIDATAYPDMQELLVATDVLITDWSSSIWDYLLTKRPIFLYYHDAEEAEKESGFYVYPDDLPFPKGHSTEELCNEIRQFDSRKYAAETEIFVSQYGCYDDGRASVRVADKIMEVIQIGISERDGV